MSNGQRRYDSKYRSRIVEKVRKGRSPAELAREIEPSEGTIRRWVKEADAAGGAPKGRSKAAAVPAKRGGAKSPAGKKSAAGGLAKSERDELSMLRKEMKALHGDREELSRLRKENHALKEERDILRQDRDVLKRAVAELFQWAEEEASASVGGGGEPESAEDREDRGTASSAGG